MFKRCSRKSLWGSLPKRIAQIGVRVGTMAIPSATITCGRRTRKNAKPMATAPPLTSKALLLRKTGIARLYQSKAAETWQAGARGPATAVKSQSNGTAKLTLAKLHFPFGTTRETESRAGTCASQTLYARLRASAASIKKRTKPIRQRRGHNTFNKHQYVHRATIARCGAQTHRLQATAFPAGRKLGVTTKSGSVGGT
jgi:hypothetical protein